MTPNDVATNVAGLNPVGNENVNWSTLPTYSWIGIGSGSSYVVDDQNGWD